MTVKKRIISLCVCLALLLTGGILGFGSKNGFAGAGNGKNERVESLETLKEVLDALNGKKSKASMLASAEESAAKYSSYTFTEVSNVYTVQKGDTGNSTVSFSRTLKTYCTEEAHFYDSEVQLGSVSDYRVLNPESGNSTKRSGSSKTALDMKVKVYVSKERSLFYLTRINYSFKETYKDYENSDNDYTHTEKDTGQGRMFGIMKEFCNRWVDCSEDPEVASAFLDVYNRNLQTLSDLGDMIGDLAKEQADGEEESKVKKKGNVYTLKPNAMWSYFGLSGIANSDDVKAGGTFKIDLSNRSKPDINYWIRTENKKYKSYAYVSDDLLIKNINNTYIKEPSASVSVQRIIERAEEMEENEG